MTREEAILAAKAKGMFLSTLDQRSDGQWQCYLRRLSDKLPCAAGRGATDAEAIMRAVNATPIQMPDAPPRAPRRYTADLQELF